MTAIPAQAVGTGSAMMMDTSGVKAREITNNGNNTAATVTTEGDKIVMGAYTSGGTEYPVTWVKLNDSGLMLSEYVLGTSTFSKDTSDSEAYYSDSDSALQVAMQAFYGSDNTASSLGLSAEEKALVSETTLEKDSMHSSATELTGQHFFPLSGDWNGNGEFWTNVGQGSDLAKQKQIGSEASVKFWWLRSSNLASNAVAVWGANGGRSLNSVFHDYGGVRPAFNANLTSVLFTSAAEGGKSSYGGEAAPILGEISGTAPTTWKMTLKDESRNAFAITENTTTFDSVTNVVSFDYTGATSYNATTAPNEYISVIIVDGDNITHYAKIAQPTAATGTASFTIPANVTGDIKIFNEQANGNNETDYASALIPLPKAKNNLESVTLVGWTYGDTAITPTITYTNDKSNGNTPMVEYKLTSEDDNTYTTTAPKNAGAYTVRVSSTEHAIVADKTVTSTFTIEQKTVGIEWGNTTFVYGGGEKSPSRTLKGVIEGDNVSVYDGRGGKWDAGTYTYIVDSLGGNDGGNYKLPSSNLSIEYTITPATAMGNVFIKTKTDNGTVDTVDVGDVLEVVGSDTSGDFDSVLPSSDNETPAFQWKRDGVDITENATGATYTLVDADNDKTITCTVTFDDNLTGTFTSNGIVVSKKQLGGSVDISGYDAHFEAKYGDTLTVDVTAVTPANDPNKTYAIQWLRDGVAIDGATDGSYTTVRDDVSTLLQVKLSGTGEYTGTLLSDDTLIIPDVPDAPVIKATAGDGKITVNWTAPFDGGAPLEGYGLLYAKTSDWDADDIYNNTAVTISLDTTFHVLTGLENGTEYTMALIAWRAFVDSPPSNIVTATPTDYVPSSGGSSGGSSSTPDNTINSEENVTADDFKEFVESGENLTVNGDDDIEVEFDSDALEAILGEAEGKDIEFIAKEADPDELTAEQTITIGDNMVLDLRVLIDGEEFTDFLTGEVTISLPYELKDGETAANLKVYYVDAEGNKTLIESSFIDGVLSFVTDHFSLYMVTYEVMNFTDVLDTDWFYEAVIYAYENGLMNGVSDTEFAPNGSTTRSMMWTVLARMDGVDTEASEGEMWYSVAQNWAIENEISDGTEPDGFITREQFVTMLYRYEQAKGGGFVGAYAFPLDFPDAEKVSEWAWEATLYMTMVEVITGMDNGNLNPQDNATRAEIATMLMRYLTISAE